MKRSFGILIVAVVASMTMAGLALAADDVEEPTELTSPFFQVNDEDKVTITVGIPDEDGELPDCTPVDDGEEAADPEAPADGDEGEVELVEPPYEPGDCVEFVIEHPSGKLHHGAIVSTVAKGLHPSTLPDGVKKGHIMRDVAKNGYLPDGFELPGDEDGGGGDDVEPKVEADKPAKGNSDNAKNKDKPNKGKKNG